MLSSVLIFVFGVLTLYLLSRLVTHPLRHMTKTVQKIAAGNLDLRLISILRMKLASWLNF
jgi:nitrate/nitrite-specific signal transduction histidine kinase